MFGSGTTREQMVRRLRQDGIGDERVLAAMAEVPRERFVGQDLRDDVYADRPLSIGSGQTISTPWIVAFMTATLSIPEDGHALEVGTGTGYAAAVLSRCCAGVVTIERHAELADRARATLAELGYDNVDIRVGDGSLGAPDRAPYDGITVTAMATSEPPQALLDQLAPEGVLVCPVGGHNRGELIRVQGDKQETLVPVAFVPLVTGE